MIVLGIESSCDELAMAVYDGHADRIRANVVHSQIELHRPFGGIVPEVASRDHVKKLHAIFDRTMVEAGIELSSLDAIAVTRGPGLIGSLLCGVEFAKGLAWALKKPLLGIHHLEGHIAASLLGAQRPKPPFVALLASGGHTSLVLVHALGGPYETLGATRDDAAGEAFDKTAKMLDLSYPGGVEIDRRAQGHNEDSVPFPKMMAGKDNLDFSFSGLKSAAARLIRESGSPLSGRSLGDFCASFQKAVVDNLLAKSFSATEKTQTQQLVLSGGVAANRRLREQATQWSKTRGISVFFPEPAHCTDNGAMIARAGWTRLSRGESHGLHWSARSHFPLEAL